MRALVHNHNVPMCTNGTFGIAGVPDADSTAGASSSSSTVTEGRAKRATAGAHAGWKHRLEEPAVAEPVKPSKKPKRDPNRVNPKAHTDMLTLRKLRAKYSVDQLEWCNRRFPLALRELGWQVLPEDAGHNYSSYGEAHYMYAYAGQGIQKRGKSCVPYFGAREEAIEWWEQFLHDAALTDGRAPLTTLAKRHAPLVRNESGVIMEAGGMRLQLQASNTRKATGYVGVTEKVANSGGLRTSVFVAKDVGEYLGSFGTAVEAARAYSQHMLAQARGAVVATAPPAAATTAAKEASPAKAGRAASKATSALPPAEATTLAALEERAALSGALAVADQAPPASPSAACEPSPGGSAPVETQKEFALRMRLAKEAASANETSKKIIRPPPLPEHLQLKQPKPERKAVPDPVGEPSVAPSAEPSFLDEIRRQEALQSGYDDIGVGGHGVGGVVDPGMSTYDACVVEAAEDNEGMIATYAACDVEVEAEVELEVEGEVEVEAEDDGVGLDDLPAVEVSAMADDGDDARPEQGQAAVVEWLPGHYRPC